MEGRIRGLFLGGIILSLLYALPSVAAEQANTIDGGEDELNPVFEPEIERRQFDEARIDTENFEVTGFLGMLSIEDFGSNPVYGARLAYHITESLFVEGAAGLSEGGDTSYEVIIGGAPLLTSDERKFTYYNVSVGFNLLPGEAFVSKQVTYNNDLFVIAGIGSTEFAGADRLTINFGLGYRLFLRDHFSIRADFRDHLMNMDLLSSDKLTHNPEFSLGLSFFF